MHMHAVPRSDEPKVSISAAKSSGTETDVLIHIEIFPRKKFFYLRVDAVEFSFTALDLLLGREHVADK